jgi:hypothetical protein
MQVIMMRTLNYWTVRIVFRRRGNLNESCPSERVIADTDDAPKSPATWSELGTGSNFGPSQLHSSIIGM